jgi:hypothetical protein
LGQAEFQAQFLAHNRHQHINADGNCQPHDVPPLVAARMLKPLGNPAANGIKYFATSDVLDLSIDRVWLAKMTNTISQHWQKKNAGQKSRTEPDISVQRFS